MRSDEEDVTGNQLPFSLYRRHQLGGGARRGQRTRYRHTQLYFESVRHDIARRNASSVSRRGIAHDGETEAHAAGRCAARIVDTIERLEQQRESLLGHAFPVVTNDENSIAVSDAKTNVNDAALS